MLKQVCECTHDHRIMEFTGSIKYCTIRKWLALQRIRMAQLKYQFRDNFLEEWDDILWDTVWYIRDLHMVISTEDKYMGPPTKEWKQKWLHLPSLKKTYWGGCASCPNLHGLKSWTPNSALCQGTEQVLQWTTMYSCCQSTLESLCPSTSK